MLMFKQIMGSKKRFCMHRKFHCMSAEPFRHINQIKQASVHVFGTPCIQTTRYINSLPASPPGAG